MWNKDALKLVQFVYLNKLFMDPDSKDNKYSVQSSLKEPDTWYQEFINNTGKTCHVKYNISVGDAYLF